MGAARRTGARVGPPQRGSGTITALVAKGRSGHRLSVHVDGKALFDLAAEVVEDNGLRQGMDLGEETQAQLLEADEPYRAREAVVAMLSRREYCAHEIAVKLRNAGYGEEAVESSIEWARERRFVDDERYAAAYIAEKMRAGWGRRRMVAELVRKGVDRDLLSADGWTNLSSGQTAEDSAATLAAEVDRRFGAQLRSDPTKGRRRAGGFLARRGHDWDTVNEVLRLVEGLGGEWQETDG